MQTVRDTVMDLLKFYTLKGLQLFGRKLRVATINCKMFLGVFVKFLRIFGNLNKKLNIVLF